MFSMRRWGAWTLGVALLVGVPVAVRALPAAESDIGAADLLELAQRADGHPFSGYVETTGNLQLPADGDFSDVGSLFGETTRMRVWWRGDDSWRVDRLLVSGEQDLIHRDGRTIAWDYEDDEAVLSRDPDIRLPRTADVVPPELGSRVVVDAVADDVARLPARTVAGIDAPGLRVEPASQASSIDHASVWVDPDSGVVLRVEVYAEGESRPSFVSSFDDFSAATPEPARTSFRPPPTAERSVDDVLDIADAVNQYAPLLAPAEAGGLPRADAADGAVGIYGSGLTQFLTIPLRDREASALREQLIATPGARLVEETRRTLRGVVVASGPLTVMLTGEGEQGGFLLAGFVTPQTLVRASGDLARDTLFTGDR